jgi:intracellular septation protein A
MPQGFIEYVDISDVERDEIKINLLECKDSIDLGEELDWQKAQEPSSEPKWKIMLYLLQFCLLDLALPVVLYFTLRGKLGEFNSTLVSSLPLLFSCVVTFIVQRSIDALPLLIFFELNLGLVLSYTLNNVLLIHMFNSLLGGTIGLVFLVSCWLSPRPIIYYMLKPWFIYTKGGLEAQWEFPYFRRCLKHITIIWGLGLVLESCIKIFIVYHVPLDVATIWNTVITFGVLCSLMTGSWMYYGLTYYKVRSLKQKANQLQLDLQRSLTIDY